MSEVKDKKGQPPNIFLEFEAPPKKDQNRSLPFSPFMTGPNDPRNPVDPFADKPDNPFPPDLPTATSSGRPPVFTIDDLPDDEYFKHYKGRMADRTFMPTRAQDLRFLKIRKNKGIKVGEILKAADPTKWGPMLWDDLVESPAMSDLGGTLDMALKGTPISEGGIDKMLATHKWDGTLLDKAKLLTVPHMDLGTPGTVYSPANAAARLAGMGIDYGAELEKQAENNLKRIRMGKIKDANEKMHWEVYETIKKQAVVEMGIMRAPDDQYAALAEERGITIKQAKEFSAQTWRKLAATKIDHLRDSYKKTVRNHLPKGVKLTDKEIAKLYSSKGEPEFPVWNTALTLLSMPTRMTLKTAGGVVEGTVFRQFADLGLLFGQIDSAMRDAGIGEGTPEEELQSLRDYRMALADRMDIREGRGSYTADVAEATLNRIGIQMSRETHEAITSAFSSAYAEKMSFLGPEIASPFTGGPKAAARASAKAPVRGFDIRKAYLDSIQKPIARREAIAGDFLSRALPGKVAEGTGWALEKTGSGLSRVGAWPERLVERAALALTGSAKAADTAASVVGKGSLTAGALDMATVAVPIPIIGPIASFVGKLKIAGAGLKAVGRTSKSAGKAWSRESQLGFLGRLSIEPSAPPVVRRTANHLRNFDPAIGFFHNVAEGSAKGGIVGFSLALGTGDEEAIGGALGIGMALGGGGSILALPWSKGLRNAQGQKADAHEMGTIQVEEHGHMTREQWDLLPLDARLAAADAQMILGTHPEHGFKIIITPDRASFLKAYKNAGKGDAPASDEAVTILNKAGYGGTIIVNASKGRALNNILHEAGGHAVTRGADMGELMGLLHQTYGKEGIDAKKAEYAQKLLTGERNMAHPDPYTAPEGARTVSDADIKEYIQKMDLENPTWWAQEIFASHFAATALGEGGIFKMSDTTHLGLSLRKAYIERVGSFLDRVGINVQRDGSIPDPTGLFDSIKHSKEITNIARQYLLDRRSLLHDVEVSRKKNPSGAKVSMSALGTHPAIQYDWNDRTKVWESDFTIKTDDGEVTLKENKKVKKALEERLKASKDLISDEIASDDNSILSRRQGGEVRGTKLPAKFYDLPQFTQSTKENAKLFQDAMDGGNTLYVWYNAIGSSRNPDGWANNVKRALGNVRASHREYKPIGFQTTKAGHILVTGVDVDSVWIKAAKWAQEGRFDSLYGGSLEVFQSNLLKYLENHQKGRPGHHEIGEASRDTIRAFLGVPKGKNPLKESLPQNNFIRTLRLDRTGSVTPTNRTNFPFDYLKVQENLMPAGGASRSGPSRLQMMRGAERGAHFMPTGRPPIKDIKQASKLLIDQNHPELFRHGGASKSLDMKEIAEHYSRPDQPLEVRELSNEDDPFGVGRDRGDFMLVMGRKTGPSGAVRVHMHSDVNKFHVDSLDAQSNLVKGGGGDQFYQAILDWAHNNNMVRVPDPSGVSEVAARRLIPHLLSSALKHGTTRHIGDPAWGTPKELADLKNPTVLVAPWEPKKLPQGVSKYEYQVGVLARTELKNVAEVFPEISSFKIDPESGLLTGNVDGEIRTYHRGDKPIRGSQRLGELVETIRLREGADFIGETTIARAARYMAQGAGDHAGSRIHVGADSQARLPEGTGRLEGLQKTFYMPAGPAEKADLKNFQISTRYPTAKGALENPLATVLPIGIEAIKGNKEQLKNHASILRKYPGIRIQTRSPERAVDEFIEQGVQNLLWLYDQVPDATRVRSAKWYDGARAKALEFNKTYGTETQGNAGAMAALSPQKDWFMNLSLAERVIDISTNQKGTKFGGDMESWLLEWGGNDPKIKALAKSLRGKTFGDLNDYGRAAFIRAYDEVNNSKDYHIVSPEGKIIGIAQTQKGAPAKVAWGSMSEINKALRSVQDPSAENISQLLGGAHKVRNFYNNILLPNADTKSVTIDTHAVAAALLRPLAGNDVEVGHNFGTASPVKNSSITGAQGTYGVYAEIYRRAAEQRGVLPRQMQSVTWEAARGLFEAKWKTKANKKEIDNIWNLHKNGKASIDESRQLILEKAGGITPPEWERSNSGAAKGTGAAGDAGKLSPAGLRKGSSGNDTGTGGRTSGRTSKKLDNELRIERDLKIKGGK